MDDKQVLASQIADIMSMWSDWYLMAPMTMTDGEFSEVMNGHYIKLREEMLLILLENNK